MRVNCSGFSEVSLLLEQIRIGHIKWNNSSESQLSFDSLCSIEILFINCDIFEKRQLILTTCEITFKVDFRKFSTKCNPGSHYAPHKTNENIYKFWTQHFTHQRYTHISAKNEKPINGHSFSLLNITPTYPILLYFTKIIHIILPVQQKKRREKIKKIREKLIIDSKLISTHNKGV